MHQILWTAKKKCLSIDLHTLSEIHLYFYFSIFIVCVKDRKSIKHCFVELLCFYMYFICQHDEPRRELHGRIESFNVLKVRVFSRGCTDRSSGGLVRTLQPPLWRGGSNRMAIGCKQTGGLFTSDRPQRRAGCVSAQGEGSAVRLPTEQADSNEECPVCKGPNFS